jgi:hypothetical protein
MALTNQGALISKYNIDIPIDHHHLRLVDWSGVSDVNGVNLK